MRLLQLVTVLTLCCAAGTATADAPAKTKNAPPTIDLKGKTLQQVFTELLPGMEKAGQGEQQRWQEICLTAGAPGNEALRKEACGLMVTKIGQGTAAPARVWLLKQLERIGHGESVAAVAEVLRDENEKVHDAAVRALAANPAPEATTKLLAGVSSAKGNSKVALLNALAYRADPAAVDGLSANLTSDNAANVSAAARALGKIGTWQAAEALRAAREKTKGKARLAFSDAYLLCADRLMKEGKIDNAALIYTELYQAEETRPLRLAALRGILRVHGHAGEQILGIFEGKDTDNQAIAAGIIPELSPAALKVLADGLEKLPVPSRVTVLNALAARGDKALLPAVLAATKSADKSVRLAGYLALGRLGDASTVPTLLEAMFEGKDASPAAREGLTRLAGEGVNEKLLAAMQQQKDAGHRSQLISILENRRAAVAVPFLLQEARGDNSGLRRSAMSALRHLADLNQLPDLCKALLKAAKGGERDEAERDIAYVCANNVLEPEKRADPVIAVLQNGPAADKAALIPLLGRIGGKKALEYVRAAVAGDDADAAAAGVQALCNWSDPLAAPDLLRIAEAGKKEQRTQALHALIRVDAIVDKGDPAEKLVSLRKAMDLATTKEERQRVVEAIGNCRVIASLRYVIVYLDDKDLNQSACRAVVELAHSHNLRDPNQAEFVRALERVIAICRDNGLVERARQYKEGR